MLLGQGRELCLLPEDALWRCPIQRGFVSRMQPGTLRQPLQSPTIPPRDDTLYAKIFRFGSAQQLHQVSKSTTGANV